MRAPRWKRLCGVAHEGFHVAADSESIGEVWMAGGASATHAWLGYNVIASHNTLSGYYGGGVARTGVRGDRFSLSLPIPRLRFRQNLNHTSTKIPRYCLHGDRQSCVRLYHSLIWGVRWTQSCTIHS